MKIVKDINMKVLKEYIEPFKEFSGTNILSDIYTDTNWDLLEIIANKKGLFLLDGILTPVSVEDKKFDEIPIIPNYIYNLLSVFDNSDKVEMEFDGNKFYIRGYISKLEIGGSPSVSMKDDKDISLSVLREYKKSTLFIPDIIYYGGEYPSIYFYDKEEKIYPEHYDIEIDATTFVNAIIRAIPKFFKLASSKKKANIYKDKITLIVYNNELYIYAFIKEKLQRFVQKIDISNMYVNELIGIDDLGQINRIEVDKIPNAIFTIDYKYLKSIKKSDKITLRIVKSPKFINSEFSDNIYMNKSLILYSKKRIDNDIVGIYTYSISTLTTLTNQLFSNEDIMKTEIGV